MSILSQRIRAHDWQNVAKIEGCSVTAAMERYLPSSVMTAINAEKERARIEAEVEAAEIQMRMAMNAENARRRRAALIAKSAEKREWVAAVDGMLLSRGKTRTDLAAVLGTTRPSLSAMFSPSGSLSKDMIKRVIDALAIMSEHMAGAGE